MNPNSRRQIAQLATQNRRQILTRLEEVGILPNPILDANQDGEIDVVEVAKYVTRLLLALDVEVPADLMSDQPDVILSAMEKLLDDVGAQPVEEETPEDRQGKADALNGVITSPVQMRARRRGQRTQLSNGHKPTYSQLLRMPACLMTYSDHRRLGMFKAGVNPDSKDGKYSAGKQS